MDLSKNFSETERKFLFKATINPSIIVGTPKSVLRYYLYANGQVELRVQQKNENEYELERRAQDEAKPLKRWGMKMSITKDEFEKLKTLSVGRPIQYRKHQTKVPGIFLKEYEGALSGFVIVEVEFPSEELAREFHPIHEWIGREVSDSPYSRDSGLIDVASWDELNQKIGS